MVGVKMLISPCIWFFNDTAIKGSVHVPELDGDKFQLEGGSQHVFMGEWKFWMEILK